MWNLRYQRMGKYTTCTHTILKKCTLEGFCKLDLDLNTAGLSLTTYCVQYP